MLKYDVAKALGMSVAGGAKLRVHLKGLEAPDLAALSRSFWQSEP